MNPIPPENLAGLVAAIIMMACGIAFYRKQSSREDLLEQPQSPPPIPRDAPAFPIQRTSPDPRDVKTLAALGIQVCAPEAEQDSGEKARAPEPVHPQKRVVYLCGECGMNLHFIEHAMVYIRGIGLVEVPRCPNCGAQIMPYRIVEKEEPRFHVARSAVLPPLPSPGKARGLGIENPLMEKPEKEEEEVESDDNKV